MDDTSYLTRSIAQSGADHEMSDTNGGHFAEGIGIDDRIGPIPGASATQGPRIWAARSVPAERA
jgi:hypothetical protein